MDPFLAYLEEQMDQQRPCLLRFRSVDGGVSEIRARIIGLSEVSGRHMIETDAGIHIGVDQLLQVNERQQARDC
jgi:hypothetical protein